MTKRNLAGLMEWLRPSGIGLATFLAYALGRDAVARFHILGPWVVVVLCGTVAFESLVLGEAASEKIGYGVSRAYQIQSGLANAALALTALLVYLLQWGPQAEATIVTAMLLFFSFSGANHAVTAFRAGNRKPVNLLRPILSLLLVLLLLPPMIFALKQ